MRAKVKKQKCCASWVWSWLVLFLAIAGASDYARVSARRCVAGCCVGVFDVSPSGRCVPGAAVRPGACDSAPDAILSARVPGFTEFNTHRMSLQVHAGFPTVLRPLIAAGKPQRAGPGCAEDAAERDAAGVQDA